MPTQYFIKFDGVEGESTNRDHKAEIDVLSWSWGLSSDAGSNTGAGSAAGKPQANDFRFVHQYDKASPSLARAGASGRAFKQVFLTARKAGTDQKDFLKVTMKEVYVTGLSVSGLQDNGIGEEVAVRPRHIDVQYLPQDVKGSLGAPVSFSWDIANKLIK
jgi:type VI secretion system secreted protein Hcp